MASYPRKFENSWLYEELNSVRNFRPMFRYGLYVGMVSAFLHGIVLRGKEPWTFKIREEDRALLMPSEGYRPLKYPKPDNQLSFDIPSSLFLSGTDHDHDQPPHLHVRNPHSLSGINVAIYDKPETHYCPAGVYGYEDDIHGRPKLQIQAQNCLHCKACDIKDPMGNIKWTVPEGGGGPNYTLM